MQTDHGRRADAPLLLLGFFACVGVVLYDCESLYVSEFLNASVPRFFRCGWAFFDVLFLLAGSVAARWAGRRQESGAPLRPDGAGRVLFRVWAAYLAAFFCTYLIRFAGGSAHTLVSRLFSYKWELFGLQMAGLTPGLWWTDLNNWATWALSSALLAGVPFLLAVLRRDRREARWLPPLAALILYGSLMQRYDTLNVSIESMQLAGLAIPAGNLRAFAGMSMGALCCDASAWMAGSAKTRGRRAVATLLEAVCCLCLTAVLCGGAYLRQADMIAFLPVWMLAVVLAGAQSGALGTLLARLPGRIAADLAQVGGWMLLLHEPVIRLLMRLSVRLPYGSAVAAVLLSSFAAACAATLLTGLAARKARGKAGAAELPRNPMEP